MQPKPKKDVYQRWWFWAIAAVLVVIVIAVSLDIRNNSVNPAPGASPTETAAATDTPVPSAAVTEQIGSGVIGDYAISIDSFELTEDYKGDPAMLVTYTWTNNSDSTRSFMTIFNAQAFQNGVECETAVILDNEKYDVNNYMADIQPGISLQVQLAYVLRDTTAPVDIIVGKLIDLSDNPQTVVQTFEIK